MNTASKNQASQCRNDNRIRYAYVKNGDVVEQFERILAAGEKKITSGPDAFIYDFLKNVWNNRVLLLSRSTQYAELQQDGLNIKAKVYKGRDPVFRRLLFGPISCIRIFLQLLRFKPQRILCGTTGGPLWVCFAVSKIFSSPLVHSRHNRVTTGNDSLHRKLTLFIDNWCIRHAYSAVCHGPYLKNELIRSGVAKDRIFEFDVNFDDMLLDEYCHSCSTQYPKLLDSKFILYIGRIEDVKGIFDLLSAFSELQTKHPDLWLVYAGTGSKLESLGAAVIESRLTDRVLLLGKVPHDDLVYIIKKCLAVVTPTRTVFPEGRCMSAMESLVMGRPVIAPNFGPFPYLVKHKQNGLLYVPDSVEDLKFNLSLLLHDKQLYQTLKNGALKSREQLVDLVASFSQAVEQAFSISKIS